jgi:polyisoprenoid-binding protein YceI
MKSLWLIFLMALPALRMAAQGSEYTTNAAHVSFFATAPVADVDAQNDRVTVTFNTSTNEVTFAMAMADFQFKNKKMGRDAEKKYLETEKYPKAGFKGKITGKVDYDKPGSYPVTAKGTLKVHGVEKEIAEKGTVVVGKGQIKLLSEFNVLLKDYKIETPTILGKEMTADRVQVKVAASLSEGPKDLSKK